MDTPTGVARRGRAAYDDRGDIILGWFTRVATFLLLIAIIGFEGISVVTAHINGADTADQVALAAADAYAPKHNVKAAKAAAEAAAIEHHADLKSKDIMIAADGSVDVTITTTATTLFLYRTDATAKWAVVKSGGHANGQFR
ncbi:MAG: hypothetical protein QOG49_820 [Frankiaceae bacterium]|nr:hypothetical protein [Frankiaceae bacterium]